MAAPALFGCHPAPPAPAPAPPATSTAQQVVDGLLVAARSGDEPGFAAGTTDLDPSFTERVRLLYTNLHAIPFAELSVRLDAERAPLDPARQRVLGPGAWRQRAVASWRLPEESVAATDAVWLSFVVVAGVPRLAGTQDGPAGGHPAQPLWWLGPVTTARRGATTVLVGAGQPAAHWLSVIESARRDVDRQLPRTLPRNASAVVVEVPATTSAFESVLGVAGGTYAEIAAVTAPQGIGGRGPTRVVVNPVAATRLTAAGLAVTLTHELVHVATDSAHTRAPTWAVEGLADYVALEAHPTAQASVARPLLVQVRSTGAPSGLPADLAFAAVSGGLDTAYAQAWLACRFAAERTSPDRLGRFYHDLDGGRSVDAAARARLRMSQQELVAGWRRYLRQLAGAR